MEHEPTECVSLLRRELSSTLVVPVAGVEFEHDDDDEEAADDEPAGELLW